MFHPTKYLHQPVPELMKDLAQLQPQDVPVVDSEVELHSSFSEDSITRRPETMLMSTLSDAALPMDHPNVEMSGVVLEEYLGGGGQGYVYLGRVTETNHIVAVKVLRSNSPLARVAALREAKLCSRVRHRNIIRVFECQSSGAFTIVLMELIQGQELAQGAIAADKRRACFAQLADALSCLREEKIVHCDIKPANILIRHADQTPVLVDFGVAQDVSVPQVLVGLSGTPYFMAPEVFRDNIPDPAWDAYGLGVTASVLFLGKLKVSTKIGGLQGDKTSGKFDRRLRLALADVADEAMRDLMLALIDDDPDIRLHAIGIARTWADAELGLAS